MASITVNFMNATLSSTSTSIILSGATFDVTGADALSISGSVTFDSLYITSGAISFNVSSGATFNAQVEAPLAATGAAPTIEVTNFQGTVTVTWPTDAGPQTQQLESGDPLTLSGYIG